MDQKRLPSHQIFRLGNIIKRAIWTPISPIVTSGHRTSEFLNADYNKAKEQSRKTKDESLKTFQPSSSKNIQGYLGTSNVDTCVEDKRTPFEECQPLLHSKDIMGLLDTNGNDDGYAMYETLKEEMPLGNSDMVQQDLHINPDVVLLDEEEYTPLYKAAVKGHLKNVDDLISQGAKPDIPSKYGLTPLHAAARKGHRDIVDYLIRQGADVNVECEKGRAPLHTAAENGHTNIMNSLLAVEADVNKEDKTGWTSFNAAVQYGHLEAVQHLVANGAKQNRYDGMTPLYAAAQSGHLHIVKFFISRGADVNEEDGKGLIPLHGAAGRGHTEVVEYLIQKGSDVNKKNENGCTPCTVAAKYGHLEVAKYLFTKGNRLIPAAFTPLFAAARFGQLDVLKVLVSEGADINEECDKGIIPLHGAARGGHLEVLKYLIGQGSNVNQKDDTGWTPLNAAVQHGHIEVMRYLKKKGAMENIYNGVTPLYSAARFGHLNIVKDLIAGGADVEREDNIGQNPLHGAAKSGDIAMMQYLIQQGSRVNKTDGEGRTPFNAAIQHGHLEAVRYLMTVGAEQTRHGGVTPLYSAASCGHRNIVELLVFQGADVNEENDTGQIPLHGAASKGHMRVVEYLTEHGSDMNKEDNTGQTPFNAAIQHGHLEVVKYLMTEGAEQTKRGGITPLYTAALFDHRNIVEFLVSQGADVNEENNTGQIPLHGAASNRHTRVMEYLTEHGSDVNKEDGKGWTPLNVAVQFGYQEAVKYLIGKGAGQNRVYGWTPLHLAAFCGHASVVYVISEEDVSEKNDEGVIPLCGAAAGGHLEYLTQQESDVNKKDDSNWMLNHAAVRLGNDETVKILVGNEAHDTRFKGQTPIYNATQFNRIDLVKSLVSRVNYAKEKCESGEFLCHHAVYNGDIEISKYILLHYAYVKGNCKEGWIPPHAMRQEEHVDVFRCLALNEADIYARDIGGLTPLQATGNDGLSGFVEYLTLHGGDSSKQDTGDPVYMMYGIYQGGTKHHTLRRSESLQEDEDKYGGEGNTYTKSPAKRFDPEQSSDVATVENMDCYFSFDAEDKDTTAIHNEYLPTMPALVENVEKDELIPLFSALLKYPEKTSTAAEQKQVNGSVPVERDSCAGRDPAENICPAQYDKSNHGFTKSTDHNAISLPNGPPTWKCDGFNQSSVHATETKCHSCEETEPICHTTFGESFLSSNARNDQPTTGTEEKFDRTILKNPPAEDHHTSNEGIPLSTKRTSTHSGWKTKKNLRSVDRPCSSILVLEKSLLHIIIALAIILAGSPVLVAGSATTDQVTLQAGKNSVIPFNLTRLSIGTSHVDPYFTLRFESKPRPFCINGHLDVDGFKSPSQLSRFTTSVEEIATSLFINLLIETVNSLDEDMYVLTAIRDDFPDVFREIVMKEILVDIPPGPANCFIGLSDDNNNPYEVHCHATTGSVRTTLACFQKSQKIDVKGEIIDNGQVTRGVFFLPDNSHFSCCSHDVDSIVNATICNDFEWPPSRKITTQGTSPSYSSRPINKHSGTTQISEEETPATSGACGQSMYRFVLWMMVLLIYLFAFVVL